LISNRNLSQQGCEDGIGTHPGNRQNIIKGSATGQHFVPIGPGSGRRWVITYELIPLSIERIDDTETTPPGRCARHRDDLARRVLSTVLVEALLVLLIGASCCQ
jgi:hypothetical protein